MTDGWLAGAAARRPAPSPARPPVWPRPLRRGDLVHWMAALSPTPAVRAAEWPPVDLYAEACAPEGALFVDGVPFGHADLAPLG